MVHFAGLNVSVKGKGSIGVRDRQCLQGGIGAAPTEPAYIIAVLTSLGVSFGRIGSTLVRYPVAGQWVDGGRTARDLRGGGT